MVSWRFEAIGAPWEIETENALPQAVRDAVSDRIAAYDLAWSRFRADSVVTAIGRGEASAEDLPPEEREPLFALYDVLGPATGGRLSLGAGAALARLGYGPPSAAIDVGAAGKGHLVDLVGDVLDAHGVDAWIVDASGDLRHRGRRDAGDGDRDAVGAFSRPIRVALEHPGDPSRAVGVVELGDAALCASAVNRRRWIALDGTPVHHVVDALTGLPTSDIVATWALARTALVADGAATALFFTAGLPAALGVEWVRITSDGRIQRSEQWPGEVYA
ncbi:MAG: FAD:protein FMN transferase [Microbacteriaceae bacterium]|nr:FAD:protein FMN transferase [Microbacteriaceae bacterium]